MQRGWGAIWHQRGKRIVSKAPAQNQLCLIQFNLIELRLERFVPGQAVQAIWTALEASDQDTFKKLNGNTCREFYFHF
jgi:hypothetical protein